MAQKYLPPAIRKRNERIINEEWDGLGVMLVWKGKLCMMDDRKKDKLMTIKKRLPRGSAVPNNAEEIAFQMFRDKTGYTGTMISHRRHYISDYEYPFDLHQEGDKKGNASKTVKFFLAESTDPDEPEFKDTADRKFEFYTIEELTDMRQNTPKRLVAGYRKDFAQFEMCKKAISDYLSITREHHTSAIAQEAD